MWITGEATNYIDLLYQLKTLVSQGSAYGLTFAGTGTGRLTNYMGATGISVAETWTITATSATNFTVVGSVTGSIGPATVGAAFSHAKLAFLISAGGTAFVAGDVFMLSTAPRWTVRRHSAGAVVVCTPAPIQTVHAQNLVDGKLDAESITGTNRLNLSTFTYPIDIEFTLPYAETVTSYVILSSLGYYPTAWNFQQWNGSAWANLDTQSGQTFVDGTPRSYPIGTPVSVTRYRLHITASTFSNNFNLGAVRLMVDRDGGTDVAHGQHIYEAPGNDGNSQIFVGMETFMRPDVDYHNWRVDSFDAFSSGVHIKEQPGFHSGPYLPLWNGPIQYWLVVNGRRAIVIAKLGGNYEMAHLGFMDAYLTPTQLPYPMALGGSIALDSATPTWYDSGFRYSNVTDQHHVFPHGDPRSATNPTEIFKYQMRARRLDGIWSGFESWRSGSTGGTPSASAGQIWPYRGGLTDLDSNINASFALWPIILNDAGPNTLGQLDGICAVSGQGISAEALIRIGAVDWIAIPDVFRTTRDRFCAVRLD